jgi:hypothetical protein
MFQVHRNLVRFSYYLVSFLAFVHLEVFQNKKKMGLLFVLQIKNKYPNRKWSFCSAYPLIGATKMPFLQNKFTNASF